MDIVIGQESFISARDEERASTDDQASLSEASRLAAAQLRMESSFFISRAPAARTACGLTVADAGPSAAAEFASGG